MHEEEKDSHSKQNEEENVFGADDISTENKNPVGPLIGIILIIVIIVLGAVFFWTQDEPSPSMQQDPVNDERENEEVDELEESLDDIDEELEDEEEELEEIESEIE